MGSSLNWLQFWCAAKCILFSFKKKTRKKKKKSDVISDDIAWRQSEATRDQKRLNRSSTNWSWGQMDVLIFSDATQSSIFFPSLFFFLFQFDCLLLLEDSKVRTKWKQLRWHQHYMYCEILQAELSLPFSVDDEKADDNFVCSCFPMCGR